MPTIDGCPEGYQNIDIEIDLSEYMDRVSIEIDDEELLEALSDVDLGTVVEHFDQMNLLGHIDDASIIAHVRTRSDLLKLALAGEIPVDPAEELVKLAGDLNEGSEKAVEAVRRTVEVLLQNDIFRLAIHDTVLRWAVSPVDKRNALIPAGREPDGALTLPVIVIDSEAAN